MKKLFMFLLSMQLGCASTYTLSHIVHAAKKNNTMQKALNQEALARESRNMATTAGDPLELTAEGVKAYPNVGNNGNEYTLGLSKNFILGDIQKQERRINQLNNQAYLLDARKNILNFQNALKNLYHQHCIDKQEYLAFQKNYRDFVKLYQKKQKAYNYQEISKTELLQLELEKNRLYAKLQSLKMQQQISKESIFRLSGLPYTNKSRLSCRDIYPIRSKINLGKKFELSQQAYEKRIQSTQTKLKRYSHALESVNVSAQYSQELDIDKYGIGVSIPLNFTSKKSEYARAAAMYENSATTYRYEQTMREKNNALSKLQAELKSQTKMVNALKKNYHNYLNKLLPLSKKSYTLGETSVIEYLLTQQKAYQFAQEMYAAQKTYYQTLFRLYSVSEKESSK